MKLNPNYSIAVFDSGLGGLSIWREVKELLPNESLIYFADQAYCPYGLKSEKKIRERVCLVIDFLLRQKIKMFVIACNTATTVGIDHYRLSFPGLPIVGVVPVIKTAAEKTQTKKVLLLATEKTIQSKYTDYLIEKFGQGVKFFKFGDEGALVKLIESGKSNSKETQDCLAKIVVQFKNKGVDVVVLGCTHFPFLRKLIIRTMGNHVRVLDSGPAVARQVKRVLERESLLAQNESLLAQNGVLLAQNQKPIYTFYSTAKMKDFKKRANQLMGLKIENLIQVKV